MNISVELFAVRPGESNPVSLHFVRSVRFAIVVRLLCRSADSFAHQASASLHLPPAALRLRPSPMHIVHWRAQGFDSPRRQTKNKTTREG